MMKAALIILSWPLLSLVNALVTSATCSTLWRWFAARDLGDGPSLAAWYGISLIVGLLVASATLSKRNEDDSDHPFAKPIGRLIGLWLACLLTIGLSWLTGQIAGWL